MSRKFIPNGDFDFAIMAESFSRTINEDPGRYFVQQADADELAAATKAYRAALNACRGGARTMAGTRVKEDARAVAEKIIRQLGHAVRAHPKISAAAKVRLGIKERTARPKSLTCPQEAPRMRFVRAHHESVGSTPMHELAFSAFDGAHKPDGATRLELFVDLIPPEETVPEFPAANHGTRPWYLRSYARSPIKLVPPIARVPMRVVYWGRWADSAGNVGPFSHTVVGWVEGGAHTVLAPAVGGNKPVPILDAPRDPGPAGRDRTFVVAVLDAQFQSMHPHHTLVESPASDEHEQRQLEGPAAMDEAA